MDRQGLILPSFVDALVKTIDKPNPKHFEVLSLNLYKLTLIFALKSYELFMIIVIKTFPIFSLQFWH
jgi:hypothetical protein